MTAMRMRCKLGSMNERNAFVTATELELLTFFEAVPELDDPLGTWCCSDALYRVARDGMELSFALNPADHDVRIILQHGERRLYELNAVRIVDVRYLLDGTRETLEVALTPTDRLLLRLRPRITIDHVVRQIE